MRVKLALFSVLFVVLVGYGFLAFSGFCFEKFEYIDEEHLIDSAIDDVLRRYPPVIPVYSKKNTDVVDIKVPESSYSYKGMDEFKNINPKCCGFSLFGEDGKPIGFFDKIRCRKNMYIRVSYDVIYFDASGDRVVTPAVDYVAMSACGDIRYDY